jgi:hypothetical protein
MEHHININNLDLLKSKINTILKAENEANLSKIEEKYSWETSAKVLSLALLEDIKLK